MAGNRGKRDDEGVATIVATPTPMNRGLRTKALPSIIGKGSVVGRYVILEELGEGGMGVVYAAYDQELKRRIALKLVQPGVGSTSDGPTRVQREAEALARLSHPNVVAVYDVGSIDDRVFIAMELVEGVTLDKWLQTKHTWSEVVTVFAAAGRGLAAAHAAGMIHRDFKPSNVIVGDDGRVRVLDFGLARGTDSSVEHISLSDLPPEQSVERGGRAATASDTALDVELTQAGSVLGTPAYMAPEATRGEKATALSDQFSYCVAFYEGLYGDRPFDSSFVEVLPPVAEPPPNSDVPLWIRNILLRGLAQNAEDRWPSMSALLAVLDDDPAIRRRKWLVGSLVAVIVLGSLSIAVLAVRSRSLHAKDDPCAVAQPLANSWDAQRRQRLESAFAASKAPDAAGSFQRMAKATDQWSSRWLEARSKACADTRKRHIDSEAVLLLRLACLDRQRDDMNALLAVFESDPTTVNDAALAVNEQPGPVLCANPRSLTYFAPPPAQSRARVIELQNALSHVKALLLAGKEADAGKRLKDVIEQARKLGYEPLLADALYLIGRQELDDLDIAIAYLDEAERVAIAGRVDTIAGRAAAMRLAQGAIAGRDDNLLADWSSRAKAWVARDGDLEAEFGYVESQGMIAANRGDHAAAEKEYRKAIELGTREFGEASSRVFGIETTLALSLIQLGRHEDAVNLLGPAIEAFERANGTSSQRLRDALDNYGLALAMIGRFADARNALERALAMGTEEPGLARAALMCDLARVALAEGKAEDAIVSGEKGIAMFKALGIQKLNLAINEDPLAGAYAAVGRHADALEQSRECLAEFKKANNEGVDTVPCLTIEGAALVDTGKPHEGLAVLERALGLQTGHSAAPGAIANLQFQLARALLATGGDHERARSLVASAATELARYPFKKPLLDQLTAWRAANQL
jgi:serine/threonine protein kinase